MVDPRVLIQAQGQPRAPIAEMAKVFDRKTHALESVRGDAVELRAEQGIANRDRGELVPLHRDLPMCLRQRRDDHARHAAAVENGTQLLRRDVALAKPVFLEVISQLLRARRGAAQQIFGKKRLPPFIPRKVDDHREAEMRRLLRFGAPLMGHQRGDEWIWSVAQARGNLLHTLASDGGNTRVVSKCERDRRSAHARRRGDVLQANRIFRAHLTSSVIGALWNDKPGAMDGA
jgi:hypothetical protein